jgi:hypothetical protein
MAQIEQILKHVLLYYIKPSKNGSKKQKKTVKNTISIFHIGNRSVILSVRQNAVRTSLVQSGSDYAGLPGFLLVFVEIMPDKVILDHKKSYLVLFGPF